VVAVLQQMRAKAGIIWIIIAVVFVGGFLFAETSGLIGQGPVTTTTVVAEVDGEDILYTTWVNASAQMAQQQEQTNGRGLTMDERRAVDEQAFNELVSDILLRREYKRRGIRVTDQEIVEMAKFSPPPQFQNWSELQTEGRFDPAKYQRFLASPSARQQGILVTLENYFRTEIPRQKLFAQVAGDEYVSDTRLWNIWRDTHDSASVSFVSFRPVPTKVDMDAVSDADIRAYYAAHTAEFDRPGAATLSIVSISRVPTAADSADQLNKVKALREEIAKGTTKFEDVAKRESDDSVSAAKGGDLGKATKGIYVKEFNDAAFSLPIGVLSQPIKTQFGYHIMRVDKRQGDSVWVHHVLKLFRQGDSTAVRTDRLADTLSKAAAGATDPAMFDAAAKKMNLLVSRISAMEGQPASYLGRQVPSVSAWAFSGPRVGETSDLFDDEQGYYLVRLDSLRTGGVQPIEVVRDEIKTLLARKKGLEGILPTAQALAKAAAASTLEAAAKELGRPVEKQGLFARNTPVASFGFMSQATGASFSIPVGSVGEPVMTDDAVFVIRVDKRVASDSAKWVAQKAVQRSQVQNSLRDQRVRIYLQSLRRAAKVEDHRATINALQRRATT
jgi:peptidyl-prolyl cis-trans isomerase D